MQPDLERDAKLKSDRFLKKKVLKNAKIGRNRFSSILRILCGNWCGYE